MSYTVNRRCGACGMAYTYTSKDLDQACPACVTLGPFVFSAEAFHRFASLLDDPSTGGVT